MIVCLIGIWASGFWNPRTPNLKVGSDMALDELLAWRVENGRDKEPLSRPGSREGPKPRGREESGKGELRFALLIWLMVVSPDMTAPLMTSGLLDVPTARPRSRLAEPKP